jgi:hypothetical protein
MQVIQNNQPGMRHYLGKWTLPYAAGMAAAAVSLPITTYAAGILWRAAGSVANSLYVAYPTATTTVTGAAVAGTTAVAWVMGKDPRKLLSEVASAGSYAALGVVAGVGYLVQDAVLETYDRTEKDFKALKDAQEKKMVTSLHDTFTQKGQELNARFQAIENDPQAVEEMKKQLGTTDDAAEEFSQAGLNPAQIRHILQPLETVMDTIRNTKQELRSTDSAFNARLLALNPEVALAPKAKESLKQAKESQLPVYHKVAGVAKGVLMGALSSVSVAGVLSLASGYSFYATAPLGAVAGHTIAKRQIAKTMNEQKASQEAIRNHMAAAEKELSTIYSGVATYVTHAKDKELAAKIQKNMTVIESSFKSLDAQKILKPLKDALTTFNA